LAHGVANVLLMPNWKNVLAVGISHKSEQRADLTMSIVGGRPEVVGLAQNRRDDPKRSLPLAIGGDFRFAAW